MSNGSGENNPIYSLSHNFQSWLEQFVFGNGLVFNQTWEDPAVDRQALSIGPDDIVVTIASAGDNVLAIALDGPKQIYAVDLNPAQIFLLQLKIIAAQNLNYDDFWHLFSLNPAPRARMIYSNSLRARLDPDAQRFWDMHLNWFRHGLCRAGVFGRTLWILRTYLKIVCGHRALEQYFEILSIAEQAAFYRKRIHARWWNLLARPFAAQLPIMLLFGAHPHQAKRVRGQRFADFLASGIQRALTTLPGSNNYFWQQVFLERYLMPPDYAQPEEFIRLKEASYRIKTQIGRLEHFLSEVPPEAITCFNLLDAADWLTPEETEALWVLIERSSAPGARVLFRTIDPSYCLPTSIVANWRDETNSSWTIEERTGVYAHVYLYRLA